MEDVDIPHTSAGWMQLSLPMRRKNVHSAADPINISDQSPGIMSVKSNPC
jgi:hypothetical protein